MAHLDKRPDGTEAKPSQNVKEDRSGNSAEAAQHAEDESEIGDRRETPDAISPRRKSDPREVR